LSVGVVEIEVLVGADQGLECTGYFVLNERTKHLRESLYVAVRGDGEEYRPSRWWEHFPILELHERGNSRPTAPNVGAKGRPVAFVCYSPAGSGSAEQGAALIRLAARELGPLLSGHLFGRMRAMAEADRSYRKLVPVKGPLHRAHHVDPDPPRGSVPEAYRPSASVLEPRGDLPAPEVRSPFYVFEAKKREYLERWGLLADYDRMRARGSERRESQRKDAPWEGAPWA
jgi:hypothetical protein